MQAKYTFKRYRFPDSIAYFIGKSIGNMRECSAPGCLQPLLWSHLPPINLAAGHHAQPPYIKPMECFV
ncbi:MAG: hypothetical protein A2W25_01565 [candidate division Zixibacteria bacterium RBG_16_53_22]|nr:MAG: hypothetical protein A2W25_01565 [candidate division Zixibacteria bacterium RBG_16_53_22]